MVVVCSNLVAGYLVGIVRLEILTMYPKIRHSDVLTEFETHEFIGLSLGSQKKGNIELVVGRRVMNAW